MIRLTHKMRQPKRLPSWIRPNALNNHYFKVGKDEYEYVKGRYYKKVDTFKYGDSFGQAALQKKCPQEATIKSESVSELAYLTKDGYDKSIKNLREIMDIKMIEFLKSQPAFKTLTYQRILGFQWQMKNMRCIRGQVVYSEGQKADHIYILMEGNFEMVKKLDHEDKRRAAALQTLVKGEEKVKVTNVLTEKHRHIEDFPIDQHISIFEKGSMIGDADVFSGKVYQSTVKCNSQKGILLKMPRNGFLRLRKTQTAWQEVLEQIASKNFRMNADDIDETEPEFVALRTRQRLRKEHADPWLFELLSENRVEENEQIKPFHEYPSYQRWYGKEDTNRLVEVKDLKTITERKVSQSLDLKSLKSYREKVPLGVTGAVEIATPVIVKEEKDHSPVQIVKHNLLQKAYNVRKCNFTRNVTQLVKQNS